MVTHFALEINLPAHYEGIRVIFLKQCIEDEYESLQLTIGMWFNIAKFTMFKENIREISEEIRVGKRDILSIYMSM